jgi:hypothetical protein
MLLGRRLFVLAGAAAACLWLLVAPSATRADCGDYVNVDGEKVSGAMGIATNHQAPAGKGGLPCSGPGCRRGPAELPSAPVPTPSQRGQEWGFLSWSLQFASSHSRLEFSPEETISPTFQPNSVFHPPR